MSDINTKINEITTALDNSLDTLESKIGRKLSAPLGGENGMVVAKDSTSLTGTKYIKPAEVITDNPLCFTANTSNQTVNISGTPVEPTILEYSRDGITWEIFNFNQNYTLTNAGDKIYLRGNNTSMNGLRVSSNTNVNVSGNIMSLLDKTCRLKRMTKSKVFYTFFLDKSNLTFEGLELPAENVTEDSYYWLFRNCTGLKSIYLPATETVDLSYYGICSGCTNLKKARIALKTSSGRPLYESFNGCTGLEELEVNFESWSNITYNWVTNASTSIKFICPPNLDTSTTDNSHVLSGWTIIRGSNEPSDTLVHDAQPTDVETFMVRCGDDVPVISVASALTLYAESMSTDRIAYSEVILDVATGATVTAGNNMTLVDTPTAGKRNICVCRWSNGVCKLYVTIVEDLPQA